MPAKRTFLNMRVRGQARFDTVPTHNGRPLPVFAEYVARVNGNGTGAPDVTVLVNTLGGVVVWSRTNSGRYQGVLVGAFPDTDKVIAFANIRPFVFATEGVMSVYAGDVDQLNIEVQDFGGTYTDEFQGLIEVRVYE